MTDQFPPWRHISEATDARESGAHIIICARGHAPTIGFFSKSEWRGGWQSIQDDWSGQGIRTTPESELFWMPLPPTMPAALYESAGHIFDEDNNEWTVTGVTSGTITPEAGFTLNGGAWRKTGRTWADVMDAMTAAGKDKDDPR